MNTAAAQVEGNTNRRTKNDPCARQLTEGISISDPENGIDETEFIDTEYMEV